MRQIFLVTTDGKQIKPEDLSHTAWADLPVDKINVTELAGVENAEIISQTIQLKSND